MSNIDALGESLRSNITRSLLPLQTVKTIDQAAFAALNQSVIALTSALKGHAQVPKALLSEIYVTIRILRAESPLKT